MLIIFGRKNMEFEGPSLPNIALKSSGTKEFLGSCQEPASSPWNSAPQHVKRSHQQFPLV